MRPFLSSGFLVEGVHCVSLERPFILDAIARVVARSSSNSRATALAKLWQAAKHRLVGSGARDPRGEGPRRGESTEAAFKVHGGAQAG